MIRNEKYDYLSNVISLLNSTEFSSSITGLARECNVPVEYMRRTIIALLKNKTLQSCINTADAYDIDGNSDLYLAEEFIDDPEEYSAKILAGEFDDTEWVIDLKLMDMDDELLSLSNLELGALKSFGENILSLKRAAVFETKDITTPIPSIVRENQKKITAAIEQGNAITFDYKSGIGRVHSLTILPVRINTNVTDNWIYVLSSVGTSYRLDRFVHICKIVPPPASVKKKPNANRKYYWGTGSSREPAPTHVKIKIYNETGNILEKIRNDLSFRRETGTFRQAGDVIYYEDDVIGIKDFQRWVRSYGSSIVVIEPRELRDDILSRAREALSLYDRSTEWKI